MWEVSRDGYRDQIVTMIMSARIILQFDTGLSLHSDTSV